MKIDSIPSVPPFHKKETSTPKKGAPSLFESAVKTDVVDFSRGQTAAPDKGLTSVKSAIMGELAQPSSAQSIARLKEQVRDGSYYRSTDEIVNAILEKI